MRNLILSATFVATSLFGLSAHAEPIEAGKQYVELNNPVAVSKPGKIEVVELFWYGCGHCYKFEDTINPWIKPCLRMSTSCASRPCLVACGTCMASCLSPLKQ